MAIVALSCGRVGAQTVVSEDVRLFAAFQDGKDVVLKLKTNSIAATGPSASVVGGVPSQEFPKTRVRYSDDFLSGTSAVSELMTSNGDVYLFRVIDRKYIPGFVGPFAREEGAVSYSLNPYIAKQWDSPYTRNPDSTLLIARNNVRSDALTYPTHEDYVGKKYSGRLGPGTKLQDIRYLNEVKVPVGKENVLRAMPLAEFQRIAGDFGKASFGLDELLTKALAR